MMEGDFIETTSENGGLSAYERAAAEEDIDPRCIPQHLDGTPPIGDEIAYPKYPQLDHENWRFLFNRQMTLLPGRAGEAIFNGVDLLGMTPDRIPALRDLSRNMEAATGWRIARPSAKNGLASCASNRSWASIFWLRWIGGSSETPPRHPARIIPPSKTTMKTVFFMLVSGQWSVVGLIENRSTTNP